MSKWIDTLTEDERQDARDLLDKLDNFSFDEEHGFAEDEYGNCPADLYSIETMVLITDKPPMTSKEVDERWELVYRAYKLGYMRALGLIPPANYERGI